MLDAPVIRRRGRRDQRHAVDHGRAATAGHLRPVPAPVRGPRQNDHLLRPSGAGQTVKLCNQVGVSVHEHGGMRGAGARGEGRRAARDDGARQSPAAPPAPGSCSTWRRRWSRRLPPGFKVWHQQKDLRLALDLARLEQRLPLPGNVAGAPALRLGRSRTVSSEAGTQALVKDVWRSSATSRWATSVARRLRPPG